MDPVLTTLIVLLVLATALGLIQAYKRDPCLSDFDDFHVTLAEQDGDLCWGNAEIYSTGMEITYVKPVRAPEGHLEYSFIFYKDQYTALDALYRYADGLTEKQRARRNAVIERTAHPGLLRRMGRRLRNWVGMVRDALLQAVSMVLGFVKTRAPGTAVLSSQEAQIKALSSEVIGHVGNAFDPLLERHLFSKVVLEVTRQGKKYSYCGWLKNYSSRFIEVVDAQANSTDTRLPLQDYTVDDPRMAGLSVSIRVEAGRLSIVNESAHVLYVRSVEAGAWSRPMGCVLPPGYTADLVLPPEADPRSARVWIGAIERFDVVAPRTHAIVRHAAERPDQRSLFALPSRSKSPEPA
jgi:hypothetical protein